MKTITAKELRLNLESVVERARAGERIRVTYRNKPAFTIQTEPTLPKRKPWKSELLKANITGGPHDLSRRIDDYLYGDGE